MTSLVIKTVIIIVAAMIIVVIVIIAIVVSAVIRVVILTMRNSDDSSATVINHSDDTPSELPIDCPGLELISTQFTTHLCILKIVAGLRFDFTEKHLE